MGQENSKEMVQPAPARHPSQPTRRMTSDKGQTTKRKPVRRNPEKRRQQNIQAQKKYRDKIKKRLEDLETLAASVTGDQDISVSPRADPHVAHDIQTLHAGEEAGLVDSHEASPNLLNEGELSTLPYQNDAAKGLALTLTTIRAARARLAPRTQANRFDTSFGPYGYHTRQCNNPQNENIYLALPDLMLERSTHLDKSPEPSLLESHTTSQTQLIKQIRPPSPRYLVEHIDCGCLMFHIQIHSANPTTHQDLSISDFPTGLFATNPYINNLNFDRICLIQAITSNCAHIGITQENYCDEDAISPFYYLTDGQSGTGNPENAVARIQNSFRRIKPDIRPVREQVLIPHNPIIDILPFPTLRRNLLLSIDSIDEDEVIHDIINGLICWGGAGMSQRDRNLSTGRLSTGTPWDSRSWEGRTWFLQKYWAMLGGEEGELVRQSEWWRNMRGDEPDEFLGF